MVLRMRTWNSKSFINLVEHLAGDYYVRFCHNFPPVPNSLPVIMANSTIPGGFIKSVLQNGVGRYVCQLQRLTLKFCKSHGGSRGMREFIEAELLDFARANPGVVVYLKPRRHRSPALSAEYLNGFTDYINCENYSREEVAKYIEYLRAKSGFPIVRLRKFWHTDNPSVQGVWTPFTHTDSEINTMTFPNESLSAAPKLEPTASDLVRQAWKDYGSKPWNPPNVVDEHGVMVK